MLHTPVAAGLQNVQEADEVARRIGMGIGERMTHARLGCEVDHRPEVVTAEQRVEAVPVREVEPREAVALEARETGKPGLLEPHVVIGVDAVESDDLAAGLEETQS